MKRLILLLLVLSLALAAAPALGEEVFTVKEPSGRYTTDRDYLRIACPVEGEQPVTVTVRDAGGSVTYQRDYGVVSGAFRSEDIYLRLSGGSALYTVTLRTGDSSSAFEVERTMPRLEGNTACSVGYPLRQLTGGSGWQSVTFVSADQGSITVPLHASGAYELGQVTFTVSGGTVTADAVLAPGVDGSIDAGRVYLAATEDQVLSLGSRNYAGPSGSLGSAIDMGGSSVAAVYVKLTVSFDPSGAAPSPSVTLPGQEALWQQMQQQSAPESVG